MSTRYQYVIYDAHKMGWDGLQSALDEMTDAGWTMFTVVPAFSELYVLWQREVPEPGPGRRGESRT